MLGNLERRRLLRELVEAVDILLRALDVSDPSAVVAAIADVDRTRSEWDAGESGYKSELGKIFDDLELHARSAAGPNATEVERNNLRNAFLGARGSVSGAHAAGRRTITIDHGGGARQSLGWYPLRASFEVEARVLSDRFGPQLVAHLLRVLAGATRIAALLDLIGLNTEHTKRDSARRERNFYTAALLACAYLKEISNTIDSLGGTGTCRRLTDPAPWVAVQNLAKDWHKRGDVLRAR